MKWKKKRKLLEKSSNGNEQNKNNVKIKWKQKQNGQNKKLEKIKSKIAKKNKQEVKWKKEIICQFSATVDKFVSNLWKYTEAYLELSWTFRAFYENTFLL